MRLPGSTTLVFVLISLWAAERQSPPARADTPLPAPSKQRFWSNNRAFYAVSDPRSSTTTIYRKTQGQVLPLAEKLWSIPGWFRVASLCDDGEHLIVGYSGMDHIPQQINAPRNIPGPDSQVLSNAGRMVLRSGFSDQMPRAGRVAGRSSAPTEFGLDEKAQLGDTIMLSFYRRDRLIKQIKLNQILPDLSVLQRTSSHYSWGSSRGLDSSDRYWVVTVDDRAICFDSKSGNVVEPAGQGPPAREIPPPPSPEVMKRLQRGVNQSSGHGVRITVDSEMSNPGPMIPVASVKAPLDGDGAMTTTYTPPVSSSMPPAIARSYQIPAEYAGTPANVLISYGGMLYLTESDGTMSPYLNP